MPKLKDITLRPTARELRWFALIDRHGPQSSEFLYEQTKDTHRSKDTALRRLQILRGANYLSLPRQQRQIMKAEFNPYVYDMTSDGFEYLSYHQPLERTARPTGHWWHGVWVAAITSSIEIEARRLGLEYVSAAKILAIRNASLAIPSLGGRLIPDQIFAIRHVDGFRAYCLEVDRGTEPVRSAASRKSLKRMAEQYHELLVSKAYQAHYGLRSNMLLIAVFTSRAREETFKEFVGVGRENVRTLYLEADFPRWIDVGRVFADLAM